MERKENRLPIFTKRFRELQGELSNTEFAEFLGLSRQTVGFYCNGDRLPDVITLLQIAKKCGVSTDWLLGSSDIKSYNAQPRIACELTGLSEAAFNRIWGITSYSSKSQNDALRRAMNDFLSNENFARLAAELEGCIAYSKKIRHYLSSIASDNKYTELGIPTDNLELLNYIKDKWGYKRESGERFYDCSDFGETIKAEQERGYSLFLCQNLSLKIINEISENIIRGKT